MRHQILSLFLLCVPLVLSAQTDKKEVREGNKLYKQDQYNEAEIAYRRALTLDSSSIAARFNLGDAMYKQKQYDRAEAIFKSLAAPEVLMTPENKAQVFHNLGNATLQQKKWQESVNAYKQSLRINPTDDETRTNLAYAQEMMEKDRQNQNQDNKNQDNKNQDNKNQDDKTQDKDQKDQDKKDEGGEDKQQQGQEPKISPQQAQQMLDAVQADEKDTQEKVKKEKAKAAGRYKTEKNW